MSDNYITKEEVLSFVEEMEKRMHGDDLITKSVLATTKCVKDFVMHTPSAQSETCEGCKHLGKWENEVEYGYPSPCTRCKRRVEDHYER